MSEQRLIGTLTTGCQGGRQVVYEPAGRKPADLTVMRCPECGQDVTLELETYPMGAAWVLAKHQRPILVYS